MQRNLFQAIGVPVILAGLLISGLVAITETGFAVDVPAGAAAAITALVISLIAVGLARRMTQPLAQLPDVLRTIVDHSESSVCEDNCELTNAKMPDDLQEVLGEVDRALSRSRNNTQARTDFVANMSHELRTPLNSIIGFAQVLQEPIFGELTDEQHSYVADILDSGNHLLALINDILDLSKIDSGKMELEADQIDLPKLVTGSIRMFREKALKESISLEYDFDDSIRFIEADERKTKQILFNLLSNAIKFTPADGQIKVRVERADSNARIIVQDSGCGIPDGEQERVFESFFQVDSILTKELEGTGLGLPIVKQIAELHSGKAWCKSSTETGSTFVVEIPIEQPNDTDVTVLDEAAAEC